jgi:hypothetical protein
MRSDTKDVRYARRAPECRSQLSPMKPAGRLARRRRRSAPPTVPLFSELPPADRHGVVVESAQRKSTVI